MTFERFTERARRVVELAKEAAVHEGFADVEIRHILIGLTSEEDGLAARLLSDLGVSWRALDGAEPSDMKLLKFGIQARTALELALREALSLGHNYIGTEHILLAVLRDPEGQALVLQASPDVNVRQLVLDQIVGRQHDVYRTTKDSKVEAKREDRAQRDDLVIVQLAVDAATAALNVANAALRAL